VAHAVEVAGVQQVDAGVQRGAMLSARSAGPYMPDMPMQPSPSTDTDGPVRPRLILSMAL
jgi:hypothetical protein